MTPLKTFTVGFLGSAALLLVVPAWADANAPVTQPSPAVIPGAATAAPAQTGARDGGTSSTASTRDASDQQRQANHKAFMDARLAALHAGLELSPQQQGLWTPVESAIRDLSKARHAMWRGRHDGRGIEGDEPGTDRTAELKQRGAELVAMGHAMDELADSAKPLLTALSEDQKARLPKLLRGLHPHRALSQAFALGRGDREGDRQGWYRHGDEGREGLRGERDDRGWRHEAEDQGDEMHRHWSRDRCSIDGGEGSPDHFRRHDEEHDERMGG